MKLGKKIMAAFLMLTVLISCFGTSTMEAQAAEKTNTYVFDSKKGVYYPTKVRAGIENIADSDYIYLSNEGDYVASVKSNSNDLVVKITQKVIYTGSNYTSVYLNENESLKLKSRWTISYHAKKKGTYTLKVTIKNAKKKTTCTKKIKVYAEEYSEPIKSAKYAGKELMYGTGLFKKSSGTLKIVMNKGFSLKKIEVGTYDANGAYKEYYPKPTYKKVKNNKKISLATVTNYTSNMYSYDGTYYSSSSGTTNDYIYPVTFVRVTYKDNKLGIVKTKEYELFYTK